MRQEPIGRGKRSGAFDLWQDDPVEAGADNRDEITVAELGVSGIAAATEMLRHGVPLDKIGLVLRHRGIDTTAYYAKADVALQKQVAQPWPEAL